ncbi:saccharopine dehydrogenase-like oxidoreductase [Pararge aegeria]|uniref:saccharopine dehydrogenase-like oxidoreductase n=1 Tax=Pararge aegeria TaxID=116150 RepID=UPI0019D29423|nr:saccharopine dehydrogenase-like oxidoreductase [Pararge aegeria]XP_039750701.1 saccharopine dehydrogenase-like oxidoreductase [Pararge aegeria]XP_039750702.1 saccharopine dehydrogenase-like oxidoreductase [Pararge aegeria]
MSRLSIVIFGATGFTGKHAVRELVRVGKADSALTWGVAGRSRDKLQSMLDETSKATGEDLSSVKIIVADVGDEKSLKEMCSQAHVLVNCCGPYRHYGEPVVRAAIDGKAHYVDVSGEPQFIESMQLEYDQQARDAGVFVISACGFDSVPNDLGVIHLQRHFGGTLNSVESYLTTQAPAEGRTSGAINYGTWESLIYGLAHYNELPALRKKLYPERLPTFKPKLLPRSVIHAREDGWCLPFPGSDSSVVYRTHRHLYEHEHKRPVQIKTYVKFPSLLTALSVALAAAFLFLLSKLSLTRGLLLKYPRVFSLGLVARGPSEEVTRNTHFKFELYGEGWEAGADVEATPPNKKVKAQVSGVNPGYGATVVALLHCALTILRERDSMPKEGGVVTTGVAFRNTRLIQRLCENNLKFEIVNDK